MSSSYIPPVIGPAGLSIPSFAAVLSYYIAQYQAIFGTGVSLDNSNSDVQLINVFALGATDGNNALQMEYNNRAPTTAIGAALASLVAINGLAKKIASFSTCQVTLVGTSGAVVTNGLVSDNLTPSNLWALPTSVVIAGGSVTVTATCQTVGAINVGPGGITGIATPTAGWVSVNNSAASSPGQPIETDSQLRSRQSVSVELPSETLIAGTYAALFAVPGVTRVNIDENVTGTTNGNSTPGHSIQAVVQGGVNTVIAQAIYDNRGIGCGTYGTTTVAVTDPNSGVVLNISFDYVTLVPIFVVVNAHPTAGGTLNATQIAEIQNAVAAYLNTLEIGEAVSFGELVQAAASVNTNPSVPTISIRSPFYFGIASSPSTSTDVAIAFNSVAEGIPANVSVTSV